MSANKILISVVSVCCGLAVASQRAAAIQWCGVSDTLVVLDRSVSMNSGAGGGSKWQLAIGAVNRFVNRVSAQSSFGLSVFPGDPSAFGSDAGCEPGTVNVPVQNGSAAQQIGHVLQVVSPNGATPIGATLQAMGGYLRNYQQQGRAQSIVLITDGMDTCGGNPVGVAQQLAQQGIGIFVIGFGSDVDPNELNQIAQAGGSGQYYQANDGNQLDQIFTMLTQMIDCCGNGVLDPGEMCDQAIQPGMQGSCQINCEDGNPCTQNFPDGPACQVQCATIPITQPIPGDGCCPMGAHSGVDPDCPASCGNGIVDFAAGENCDVAIPPGQQGSCEIPCEDGDPCTLNFPDGQPCFVQCVTLPVFQPFPGDMCCPPGANSGIDPDCPPFCGNEVVDPIIGENCDIAIPPGFPGTCDIFCEDGDPCTLNFPEGQPCAMQCQLIQIIEAVSGDGCCLPGTIRAQDLDCPPGCGDGLIDFGETCDIAIPPGHPGTCDFGCDDGNPCTIDTLLTAPCGNVCDHALIVHPVPGDGCCPLGANADTDADCPVNCGNGRVDPGEKCDVGLPPGAPGSCPSDCPPSGDPCSVAKLVGGACNLTCRNEPIKPDNTQSDGCCPEGNSRDTDPDCLPACTTDIASGCIDLCTQVTCDEGLVCRKGTCLLAEPPKGSSLTNPIPSGSISGASALRPPATNLLNGPSPSLATLETGDKPKNTVGPGCQVTAPAFPMLSLFWLVLLGRRRRK